MTIRHLEYFFAPTSVAVIGASTKHHSVGATVFTNLRHSFRGALFAVNPHHHHILDLPCYPDLHALPSPPDLAVICTPPGSVPALIAQLGTMGCKAAVVITGGFNGVHSDTGRLLTTDMLEVARPHGLRILGPNCLGLLVPGSGLNASFAHTDGIVGSLAFVSQSGALATAVLDWSKSRGIGFSAFVTIGDAADVDLGDLLDYLASDANTSAILLYIESIKHARKFMSAARAAARGKPVIAVKSGRAAATSKAIVSHTGALAGSDDVVDCALRRAGVLRVGTLQDLFDAAETLARAKPLQGEGLAIITNGGGAGILATDALIGGDAPLAALSDSTLKSLDHVLPATWSHGNPVDIIGDAPAERYAQALMAVTSDPSAAAVLLIHAPTAIVSSADIARACLPEIQRSVKTVLTCWLGETGVQEARQIFAHANIPTYSTPEEAVRGFLQLRDFDRGQALLMQTPPAYAATHVDAAATRNAIAEALQAGCTLLTEIEAKRMLSLYGIPVVQVEAADNVDDAVACAQRIGFPVVLKILSPDITHKSDVGGVALRLRDAEALRHAAHQMLSNVSTRQPQARILGFTVQPMIERVQSQWPAHELILGCVTDPTFGPVIMFGQGGTGVEVMRDRAFALPPLNVLLAKDLIAKTRVSKLLAGYRDRPAVNEGALIDALLKLSQLICDQDEIVELDINPLIADENGVMALDARIRLAPRVAPATKRLAILPYPNHLSETTTLVNRPVLLRPIRAEDEPMHQAFLERLAPEDVHLRFFHAMRSWSHHQLARFTQIDYDREMAFVAVTLEEPVEILGVARAIGNPDNTRAEFAIVVRSDHKGKGVGHALMRKLIDYQRAKNTQKMVGDVLATNIPMLHLASKLGFSVETSGAAEVLALSLKLH